MSGKWYARWHALVTDISEGCGVDFLRNSGHAGLHVQRYAKGAGKSVLVLLREAATPVSD